MPAAAGITCAIASITVTRDRYSWPDGLWLRWSACRFAVVAGGRGGGGGRAAWRSDASPGPWDSGRPAAVWPRACAGRPTSPQPASGSGSSRTRGRSWSVPWPPPNFPATSTDWAIAPVSLGHCSPPAGPRAGGRGSRRLGRSRLPRRPCGHRRSTSRSRSPGRSACRGVDG